MDIATATKDLKARAAAIQRAKETQHEKMLRELLAAAQTFVGVYQKADAQGRVRMILGLEGDEAALLSLVRYMYACGKNSAAAMARSRREAETIVSAGIAAYVIIADRLLPASLKKAEDALVAQADRLNIPLDTLMAQYQPPAEAYIATAEAMAATYYRDGAIHAVGHLLRMFPHVERDKKVMEVVTRISGLTAAGALRDLPDHYLRGLYVRDRADRAPHVIKAADVERDARDALDVAPVVAASSGNAINARQITTERFETALSAYAEAQRDPKAPLHLALGLVIALAVLAGAHLAAAGSGAPPGAQVIDLFGLIIGSSFAVMLGLLGLNGVITGRLGLPRRVTLGFQLFSLNGLPARATGWLLLLSMLLYAVALLADYRLVMLPFLADASAVLRLVLTSLAGYVLAFPLGLLLRLFTR